MLGGGLVMDVTEAFNGLEEPLIMQIVSFDNTNNGISEKTILRTINFYGVIRYSIGQKELKQLPEGYRAWDIAKLHTRTLFEVDDGDQIIITRNTGQTTTYKIVGKKPNSSYSFYTYYITQRFNDPV